MDTRRFTNIKIARNDFNEGCETNEVKHELRENDDFNESGKNDECSVDETDFMDNKNTTDSQQEQNEKKLDVKEPIPEEKYHSEYSQKLWTSKCNTAPFKSEDDTDIFYEDIKLENDEEKTSKLFKFCEVCYQSFDRETDVFETKSFRCNECMNETNAVKHELSENDDFNESGKNDECSVDETDFMDNKNTTDSQQEQNEKKLDVKELIPEEKYHSEYSQKLWTSKCNTAQFKSEDDTVIFYEDIKRENDEEKTSKLFCEVCYQSFRSECSCQPPNEPLFYKIRSEDMTPAPHGLVIDSELQLEVQDEALSGDEVTKEQGTCALPRRFSKRHMENGNYMQSKLCSKPLEKNLSVEHQMSVTAEKKNQCKFCSRGFGQLKIHAEEKPTQCKKISKSLSKTSHFKIHERGHTGEKLFQCEFCSKTFSDFRTHNRIHTGEKSFHCKVCSKSFSHAASLKVHERDHKGEKPFYCKVCSKSFSNAANLKVHERVHTGEKPFHCKECSKSFSRVSNLKVHERVHSGEKPFHCKVCSKSFRNAANLKVHERVHTGEKPFHCKVCSKSFSHAATLKVHERDHTGEKPFYCKVCSKSFSNAGNLKVHERVHSGEKPFHCKICSKSFSQTSHLKVHENCHTGEKTFQCKICSKTFTNSGNLRTHERIHTREKPSNP